MDYIGIMEFICENCKIKTPHKEDLVYDEESATVWHCLYCGTEFRPRGGNAMVPTEPPVPVLPASV